jgi:4a-hydroxytetrahydrobiopterin dehydratase
MVMSRLQASAAVSDLGWRFLLGFYCACVPVTSLTEAGAVAARVLAVPGIDGRTRVDLRSDRVVLTIHGPDGGRVTESETELVRRISALGLPLEPASLQTLELAIDAMDIPAVRPFWKSILGYAETGAPNDLVDPRGQGPAVWFQQMDTPRPQRNRIHFDLTVPHDQAQTRIAAALAAGGKLISDSEAPAFWVLADPEGNEVCVCTWQGRD